MEEMNLNLLDGVTEEPAERYQFRFAQGAHQAVYKFYRRRIVIGFLLYIGLSLYIIIAGAIEQSQAVMGFGFGYLLAGLGFVIRNAVVVKKNWKEAEERLPQSVFEYRVYSNCVAVMIAAPNQSTQTLIGYHEIKDKFVIGELVTFVSHNRIYCLRKDELLPNSFFLYQSKVKK